MVGNMSKLDKVKALVKELNSNELARLLDYIRGKSDIIMPKCYTKDELVHMLKKEGINGRISESDFDCLKNELNNGCNVFLNEVLRTKLIVALDKSHEQAREYVGV